jgi:predicted AAA+ superfamily ATPase
MVSAASCAGVIAREELEATVRRALARSRAVVLTGPRQSGKTTLARQILSSTSPNYFDLENPLDAARLEQPFETLSRARTRGARRSAAPSGALSDVEIKRADAPQITKSMRIAIDDLGLDALYVVYPGDRRFVLAPGIEAVPLWALMPARAG